MTQDRFASRLARQLLSLTALLAVVAGTLALVGDGRGGPAVLGARTVHLPENGLSIAEISAIWTETLAPAGPAPVSTGSVQGCVVGTVDRDYRADQVARVNAYRRLAGLREVQGSDGEHAIAQRAALWVAANRRATHEAASDSACYAESLVNGKPAVALSLLYTSLADPIGTYIRDADRFNVAVGHRRWLLASNLVTLDVGAMTSGGHAVRATASGAETPVAWPAPGRLPTGVWIHRWSLALPADVDGATVTVQRNGTAVPATIVYRATGDSIPGGGAVVFDLPADATPSSTADTTYDVRIDGIVEGGVSTTYTWTTTFSSPDPARVDTAATTASSDELIRAIYRDLAFREPTAAELAAARSMDRAALLGQLTTGSAWVGGNVAELYRRILGREGDAAGMAWWTDEIAAGRHTLRSATAEFYGSPERVQSFASEDAWIDAVYRALLGRPVDEVGRDNARSQLAGGVGHTQVVAAVYDSEESRRRRVSDLYATILDRSPDADGFAYWPDRLLTTDDLYVAAALADSPEYERRNS